MITAEVFVAFVETPRNGEAGDDAAQKILGLVRAQDRGRGSVEIVLALRFIEFEQRVLPLFPVEDVMLAEFVVILKETGAHLLPGFTPYCSESQGQHELSVTGRQVNLTRAGEVAIFRALVFPLHLEVSREVLPSVGGAHESHRHLFPRRRVAQSQC